MDLETGLLAHSHCLRVGLPRPSAIMASPLCINMKFNTPISTLVTAVFF